MKLTIKQYAENEGISVQSVYAQIERGSLKSIKPKKDNITDIKPVKKRKKKK